MSDLAVLVEVLTESTETTSNGTVRQHPAGVLTALRQTRPASAVPDQQQDHELNRCKCNRFVMLTDDDTDRLTLKLT